MPLRHTWSGVARGSFDPPSEADPDETPCASSRGSSVPGSPLAPSRSPASSGRALSSLAGFDGLGVGRTSGGGARGAPPGGSTHGVVSRFISEPDDETLCERAWVDRARRRSWAAARGGQAAPPSAGGQETRAPREEANEERWRGEDAPLEPPNARGPLATTTPGGDRRLGPAPERASPATAGTGVAAATTTTAATTAAATDGEPRAQAAPPPGAPAARRSWPVAHGVRSDFFGRESPATALDADTQSRAAKGAGDEKDEEGALRTLPPGVPERELRSGDGEGREERGEGEERGEEERGEEGRKDEGREDEGGNGKGGGGEEAGTAPGGVSADRLGVDAGVLSARDRAQSPTLGRLRHVGMDRDGSESAPFPVKASLSAVAHPPSEGERRKAQDEATGEVPFSLVSSPPGVEGAGGSPAAPARASGRLSPSYPSISASTSTSPSAPASAFVSAPASAPSPASAPAPAPAPPGVPSEGGSRPSVLGKLQKWSDYPSVGEPVYPARLIPMKTPMSLEILSSWSLEQPPKHPLSIPALLEAQRRKGRNIGMIVDLAAHECLYAEDLPGAGEDEEEEKEETEKQEHAGKGEERDKGEEHDQGGMGDAKETQEEDGDTRDARKEATARRGGEEECDRRKGSEKGTNTLPSSAKTHFPHKIIESRPQMPERSTHQAGPRPAPLLPPPPSPPPPAARIRHVQIPLEAKVVPPPSAVERVAAAVSEQLSRDPTSYVAIHCAYGFNRTGFLVCSYLCREMGMTPQQALDAFAKARPPGVRHERFVQALHERYGNEERIGAEGTRGGGEGGVDSGVVGGTSRGESPELGEPVAETATLPAGRSIDHQAKETPAATRDVDSRPAATLGDAPAAEPATERADATDPTPKRSAGAAPTPAAPGSSAPGLIAPGPAAPGPAASGAGALPPSRARTLPGGSTSPELAASSPFSTQAEERGAAQPGPVPGVSVSVPVDAQREERGRSDMDGVASSAGETIERAEMGETSGRGEPGAFSAAFFGSAPGAKTGKGAADGATGSAMDRSGASVDRQGNVPRNQDAGNATCADASTADARLAKIRSSLPEAPIAASGDEPRLAPAPLSPSAQPEALPAPAQSTLRMSSFSAPAESCPPPPPDSGLVPPAPSPPSLVASPPSASPARAACGARAVAAASACASPPLGPVLLSPRAAAVSPRLQQRSPSLVSSPVGSSFALSRLSGLAGARATPGRSGGDVPAAPVRGSPASTRSSSGSGSPHASRGQSPRRREGRSERESVGGRVGMEDAVGSAEGSARGSTEGNAGGSARGSAEGNAGGSARGSDEEPAMGERGLGGRERGFQATLGASSNPPIPDAISGSLSDSLRGTGAAVSSDARRAACVGEGCASRIASSPSPALSSSPASSPAGCLAGVGASAPAAPSAGLASLVAASREAPEALRSAPSADSEAHSLGFCSREALRHLRQECVGGGDAGGGASGPANPSARKPVRGLFDDLSKLSGNGRRHHAGDEGNAESQGEAGRGEEEEAGEGGDAAAAADDGDACRPRGLARSSSADAFERGAGEPSERRGTRRNRGSVAAHASQLASPGSEAWMVRGSESDLDAGSSWSRGGDGDARNGASDVSEKNESPIERSATHAGTSQGASAGVQNARRSALRGPWTLDAPAQAPASPNAARSPERIAPSSSQVTALASAHDAPSQSPSSSPPAAVAARPQAPARLPAPSGPAPSLHPRPVSPRRVTARPADGRKKKGIPCPLM